ncbi:hypothetical protein GH714_003734 [Hevea brasiliensis]|uniref:Plant bHLH transcription factor ACT-like domain-containing protein n=1 Tax=Hevea brasiliensis TaxID=3981 RepID=A0A6A6NFG5_HEVBR|nr:hypothetical protein GH714_003734 [Hevea brasiliensis]
MELNYQHGYIEELLALRRDAWETIPSFPTEMGELFSNGWNLDCFDDNPAATLPPISFHQGFSSPLKQDFNNYYLNEVSCPFGNEFSTPPFQSESQPHRSDSSYNTLACRRFLFKKILQCPPWRMITHGPASKSYQSRRCLISCKVEPIQSPEMPVFNIGSFPERKMRMDRTSILGDTIDYVKELLERIQNLQQEIEVGSDQLNMMGILKDTKSSEFIVRNSPKFDVERVNEATRIEICCAAKPGLLLSTVNTLETLGLEIQQCVISCFNDFAMQASCSEELEQRRLISSEDIKQAF